MSEAKGRQAQLTEFVLTSFPNVMEPKAVKKNGKPTGDAKYSHNYEFLPDSADLKALKAEAVAAAKERWPGRDLKELTFPFHKGDKLADKAASQGKAREWSRGREVLVARSKFEPQLSVVEGGKIVEYEGDRRPQAKKFFYNGVLCLAQFNFQAYEGVGNNPDGVTCYLNMVCSSNKGTKLSGGGGNAAETFKGCIGLSSAEDPTLGMDDDDEVPF